tara:strand:+ start:562 stop:1044 length:483 start_codon:yes stop_codon:yes gene_type:complete
MKKLKNEIEYPRNIIRSDDYASLAGVFECTLDSATIYKKAIDWGSKFSRKNISSITFQDEHLKKVIITGFDECSAFPGIFGTSRVQLDFEITIQAKDNKYKIIISNTRVLLLSSGYSTTLKGYYDVEGQDCIKRIWNPAMGVILEIFNEFEKFINKNEDW